MKLQCDYLNKTIGLFIIRDNLMNCEVRVWESIIQS